MRRYEVVIGCWRSTCVRVEAKDEEEAIKKAQQVPLEDDAWYDNDYEYQVEEATRVSDAEWVSDWLPEDGERSKA